MIEPVKNRTQRVIAYGPLRTIVEVVDQGWVADEQLPPVNMTLRYTLYAGHRDIEVEGRFMPTIETRMSMCCSTETWMTTVSLQVSST